MNSNYKIIVVGCGGIGSYVLELLPQVMACLNLDKTSAVSMQHAVAAEGLDNCVPNLFHKLVLVDGDFFVGHNALRQAGITGSKVAVQMQKIRSKDAFTTWLHTTELIGWEAYIKPSNMSKIIGTTSYGVVPIILLCVDNHKTRYEVTRWAEENLRHFLIINGGNQKVHGNVTVYQRYYGENYDPPIYKLYPEVTATADRRPDEVHCDEVHASNDQTALINNMIATIMLNMLRKFVMANGEPHAFNQKLRQKGPDGQNLFQRKNEIIIDLEPNSMMALSHSVSLDNRRAPVDIVTNQIELPENADLN